MNYKNKKDTVKGKIVLSLALVIFLVSGIISYVSDERNIWEKIFRTLNLSDIHEEEKNYDMIVSFIDVGKADCAYIRCCDINILIDSGDRDISKDICKYLKKRDVQKLDLVIASHPHRDHIGQMYNVIENFEIGTFIMSEMPYSVTPTSFTYRKMIEALNNNNNINVKIACPREVFSINNDLKIEILGPWKKHENINDNSVIAKIRYKSKSFLFMGDAEKSAEDDLVKSGLNLHSSVLKVGHHGSKTSTTEKFIQCVKPEYAVISTKLDKNKSLSNDVLDRLERFKIKVFRTDVCGTVTFLTDGQKLETIVERTAA